jgi:hypothetical protein
MNDDLAGALEYEPIDLHHWDPASRAGDHFRRRSRIGRGSIQRTGAPRFASEFGGATCIVAGKGALPRKSHLCHQGVLENLRLGTRRRARSRRSRDGATNKTYRLFLATPNPGGRLSTRRLGSKGN